MFPFTRVPGYVPIFDPHPTNVSFFSRTKPLKVGVIRGVSAVVSSAFEVDFRFLAGRLVLLLMLG